MSDLPNVRIPQWGGWENWLEHAEDRVDDALSSSNHVLNVLLSPVRDFVRLTLHPLFNFADFLWRWGLDVTHWLLDRASDLGWDILYAMVSIYNDAVDFATFVVGVAVQEARDLFDQAERDAAAAIDAAIGGLGSVADTLRDFATDLFWKAIGFAVQVKNDVTALTEWLAGQAVNVAEQLVATARIELAGAIDFVANAAHDLFDNAIDFARGVEQRAADFAQAAADKIGDIASAAIDVIRRDVIEPLIGAFRSFIDNEWQWAADLLKILEDAADWILWVGSRIVPDAVDLYRSLQDFNDQDFQRWVEWGAKAGVAP